MNNSRILSALDLLEPVGLDCVDKVRLMNRIETKYVFSVRKLEDMINLLKGKYHILEINNSRAFQYSTTYMDTSDYHFYNQHVRGELERHKVRFRKYDITQTSYLEIKKKTNKGRTVKQRIKNSPVSEYFDGDAINFMNKYSPLDYSLLKPVLMTRYTRVTAIEFESKERITFDFDISFSAINGENQITLPYLAVAELKKNDYTHSSPFKGIIKRMNIYPAAFSKYCIGSAILNAHLKKNMVKPKILLIKRIENEYVNTISNGSG